MRLKLTIAYDGAPFAGWQIQPDADTIQARIESAMAAIAKEKVALYASGRTDTGVHALGQVAHFDAPDHLTMNPYNWVPALNTKLPPAIRIMACDEVVPDFHARFDALEKTYRYEISTLPVLPPFLATRAWHLPRQLDPYLLADALALFVGRHDFRAFAAFRGNETADTDYHRTISCASSEATENGYRLLYTGDGFLYKMVRLLTGAALKVAQGQFRLDDFQALLENPGNQKSPHATPADGLSLDSVRYADRV